MPETYALTPGPLHKALTAALPQGGELELKHSGPDAYAFQSLRVGEVRVFDFALAVPFIVPALAKADTPIPDGARWITVHPNGEGSKGVPVLVQEQKKGAGIWHVIGGAGGSLNHLKIRGVKSEAYYRQEAAERAGLRRAKKKAQAKLDKQPGVLTSKREACDKLRAQVVDAEREFVKAVAAAQGWHPADLVQKGTGNLSPEASARADKLHHRELLRRATKAVRLQRQPLRL